MNKLNKMSLDAINTICRLTVINKSHFLLKCMHIFDQKNKITYDQNVNYFTINIKETNTRFKIR
jgi:hypothetical protein